MNYQFNDEYNTANGFNNVDNNFSYINSKLSLYNPLESYIKGNLFANLYDPYKDYQPPMISINSEQEELLTSIGEYSFAAHDLNLYLDVYPNNQEALGLFNKYRMQSDALIKKYEREYGPINISQSTDMNDSFIWSTSKWPWEV